MQIAVVAGYETSLRHDVEAVVTGEHPQAFADRIDELSTSLAKAGTIATFGAEIECCFVADSSRSDAPLQPPTREKLYNDIVCLALDKYGGRFTHYPKGKILTPDDSKGHIMINEGGYPSDPPCQSNTIIELRTMPAEAPQALERYWDVIQIVGEIANRNKLLAFILSTHINAGAVTVIDGQQELICFEDESYPNGKEVVAMTQRNLVALQPLQLDAGVGSGVVVLQAFPEIKSSSMTVHEQRLEMRHADVGIADPRIDMLSFMSGLRSTLLGDVPKSIMKETGYARAIDGTEMVIVDEDVLRQSIVSVVMHLAVVDDETKRFRTPESIDLNGMPDVVSRDMRRFMQYISEDPAYAAESSDQIVKEFISHCYLTEYETLGIDDDYRFKHKVERYFDAVFFVLCGRLPFTEPNISLDTPQTFAQKRTHLPKSAVVREVLGDSVHSLVPASEVIVRKDRLFTSHFIEVEEE